jgi:hypothetical protein
LSNFFQVLDQNEPLGHRQGVVGSS